ncbi:MAG TPA: hypothetical protein VKB51_19655 [bacterium]|nr:hypothetical protein [bacterium]
MASFSHPTPLRPVGACGLLLVLAALVLAACSSPLSMEPIKPDPGIAANLAVVQAKTEDLFAELGRNAAMPFADYDAIHYRPLLEVLMEARRLAVLHERPDREIKMLDDLRATYEDMRTSHRQGKLSFESLQTYRKKLAGQIDGLMRLEQAQ